jgi:hypothetical protein
MMNVWVLQGCHEGELFSSVHLTEKGAQLAAIADVFEFLGIEDEEDVQRVMSRRCDWDGSDIDKPYPWRWSELNSMTRKDLWEVFDQWNELTWDNDYGYQMVVDKRIIQP